MTASDKNIEYWKQFWNDKDQPLHRADTDEHYDQYAGELRLLVGDCAGRAVFEVGCGNGVLYQRLGFDRANYVGVDLSDKMIEKFNHDFPHAELHVGSATDFRQDRKFDLIFSNGVIQNLDAQGMDRHLQLAEAMLRPEGAIIHASVPWKNLFWYYYTGAYSANSRRSGLRSLIGAVARRIGIRKDPMGVWYSQEDLIAAGAKYGLKCEFFGSLYYPYRFHVKLTRR